MQIQGETFVAERRAATEEDHHFGVQAIWNLTDETGNGIARGLVRWMPGAGGGWGFWRGGDHDRLQLATHEVLWLEVDEPMRRWLNTNSLPPCLLDAIMRIVIEELDIYTLCERGRDHLDFPEVSVVSLRRAMERAYLEGMQRSAAGHEKQL
ncbi:MAG: hypothetical protein WD534_11090 [Phycisphaeraceae bacterium]